MYELYELTPEQARYEVDFDCFGSCEKPEPVDPRDIRDAGHFVIGLLVWFIVGVWAWWIS